MKLENLLIEQPMMDKISAAPELPNSVQMEQDFGKLSFAFLKDRAPKLLPYMIGFEIVEASDDGSRALGIFGFKVGPSIYYVPVFFMNNQIKGMVEIYSRDTDSFVPLREGWVSQILMRQSSELGETAPAEDRETFSVPDFSAMVAPPQLGYGAAVKSSEVMADLKRHFIKVAGDTLRMLETDTAMLEMLAGAIGSAKGASMEKKAASESQLISFVRNHGGPDMAKGLARMLQNPGFAKAASVFYDFRDLLVNEFDASLEPKKAEQKVTVVTESNGQLPADTDNKKRLLTYGFYIDDKRSKDEKAEAFDYISDDNIVNPTEPGKYKVILTSGLAPCYVLMPTIPGNSNRMMLVIDDDGNYFTAHSRRVFVNGEKIGSEAAEDIVAGASDLSDLKVGGKYVLINSELKSSLPFIVKSAVSFNGDKVYYVDFYQNILHDLSTDDDNSFRGVYDSGVYDVVLRVSPTAGAVRVASNTVLVPEKSWKVIELKNQEDYGARIAMEKAFAPASYAEIVEAMFDNGIKSVAVDSKDAGLSYDIWIDGMNDNSNMSYKNACVRLVMDYGLSVEDAEAMLKEASLKFKSRRLVKLAQVPMQVVPGQLSQQMPMGYDPTTGAQVQQQQIDYSRGQTVVPPPQDAGPGTGINIGGEAERQQMMAEMDPTQLAQMAAQSGQKQVFDQTAMVGLARTYDVSNIIDGFIPDFMKSLDKLGRLIFLLNWKYADFAERFGSEDLPAIEDMLGSVFKNFGDLVLKLKQRTLTPDENFVI